MLTVIVLAGWPLLGGELFENLLSLVSGEKRERIRRFKSRRDAQNCLLGDIITRSEIVRLTGIDNARLLFSLDPRGKPFFVNDPRIHFNISHSGPYVAAVVSDEKAGIDIETIRKAPPRVAEKFFSPEEIAYVGVKNHPRRFYEVWTKKESALKQDGRGLRGLLSSRTVPASSENETLFYHKVFQNSRAVCHLCTAKNTAPSVRIIDRNFETIADGIRVGVFAPQSRSIESAAIAADNKVSVFVPQSRSIESAAIAADNKVSLFAP